MSLNEKIANIIKRCQKESSCNFEVRYNEPMSLHTTFKTGGPADCWIKPTGDSFPVFTAALMKEAKIESVPVFFFGGGANILVADAGIHGIVVDMGGWTGENIDLQRDKLNGRKNTVLVFYSGTKLDDAAEIAAENDLSGLEFLAGMPGTIGGAVWMNARCYGCEIADVLGEIEMINFNGTEPVLVWRTVYKAEFGYKFSPFQNMDALILSASFRLIPGNREKIRAKMETHRKDREEKGHYRFPSAGSVFKNSPFFGRPSGKIIDDLGLRGLQTGGAQVAPWHGNIIINTGGASSSDIRALIDDVAARVKSKEGFSLEPEILFLGEWE